MGFKYFWKRKWRVSPKKKTFVFLEKFFFYFFPHKRGNLAEKKGLGGGIKKLRAENQWSSHFGATNPPLPDKE